MSVINSPHVRVIEDRIARHPQAWSRVVTVQTAGVRVRATIHRDFYDKQSQIYTEVWSPDELKWNRIETLSGLDHGDLPSSSNHDHSVLRHATDELLDDMLRFARDILGSNDTAKRES